MAAYIRDFLDFVSLHPHLAGLVTFLTAAAEAVAVVGSAVPGTTILIGIGALVGYGHLELWPILAWATAGAIAGDGISYWIGHTYKDHIRQMWPFSRRPELIDRGEAFFSRYGARSVVVGRFVPMMRAIVPVVAGIMDMRPTRFYAANVVSALLWAPAHILPGALAGVALLGLGAVSGRLVIALVTAGIGAVLTIWLARLAVGLALRYAPRAQSALARWGEARHDRIGSIMARLASPAHSDFRLFVLLNAVLIGTVIGFAALLEDVVTGDAIIRFDHAFSQFLQSLRTSWTDSVMVAVTMLGDWLVASSVTAAGCIVLLVHRRLRLLAGLITALASTMVFVQAMKLLVHASRPIQIYSGASEFSFPSGHATMTATLYGVLGWIVIRGSGPIVRNITLATFASLIALVAFSRIYLAAHWPSDVAAGLLFGAGVTAGFALVFRGHEAPRRMARWLLAACGAALVTVGSWHVGRDIGKGLSIYARQPPPAVALSSPWREGGWRDLPAYRVDVAGQTEEPLLLQWRGGPAALMKELLGQGWLVPPEWSMAALNGFVLPDTGATDLPVIPKLHDGHRQTVTLIRPDGPPGQTRRYVLRAWPQEAREPSGALETILLGSITLERIFRPLNQLSIPFHSEDRPCEAEPLLSGLPNARFAGSPRPAPEGGCGGRTVLAGP